MKKAGDAMKQIHGQLDITKVDETMYVMVRTVESRVGLTSCTGRNFENSTHLAKKLQKLLLGHLSESLWMRANWMMN